MIQCETPTISSLRQRLPAKFFVKLYPAGALPTICNNKPGLVLYFFKEFHAGCVLVMINNVAVIKVRPNVHGVCEFKDPGRDLV